MPGGNLCLLLHPQETTDRLRNLVNVRKPDGSMYSEFDFACRSLVPLFAARTIEEIIYGKDGISLSTTLAVSNYQCFHIKHLYETMASRPPCKNAFQKPLERSLIEACSPHCSCKLTRQSSSFWSRLFWTFLLIKGPDFVNLRRGLGTNQLFESIMDDLYMSCCYMYSSYNLLLLQSQKFV